MFAATAVLSASSSWADGAKSEHVVMLRQCVERKKQISDDPSMRASSCAGIVYEPCMKDGDQRHEPCNQQEFYAWEKLREESIERLMGVCDKSGAKFCEQLEAFATVSGQSAGAFCDLRSATDIYADNQELNRHVWKPACLNHQYAVLLDQLRETEAVAQKK